MAFDAQLQRRIMGCFATGVTVVTTRVGEEFFGMTANAVTSLSLDPPLVLVAVDKGAGFHGRLKEGGCFAINILTDQQEDLSTRFAARDVKQFADIPTKTDQTGAPIFTEALGYVDCRLSQVLPGGDHDIFIGEVLTGEVHDAQPLLFHAGKYRRLADA